jgi:hypothetical protein
VRLVGFLAALAVFVLALPFHRTAQAYGNLLVADLLLLITLGWSLRSITGTQPPRVVAL